MFGNWLGVSQVEIVYHTSRSKKVNFVTIYGAVHMAQMLMNEQWSPMGQPLHSIVSVGKELMKLNRMFILHPTARLLKVVWQSSAMSS